MQFPSLLETLSMLPWVPNDKGHPVAPYPNGIGYMIIKGPTLESYEVCADGSEKLMSTHALVRIDAE